jgi:uncharacterized linocin/CFP29 family protein
MDDRDAQVGWTEAQWNRVREEVLRAWQRVRVAGSFLPVYGPLPPSTQVVPSEIFKPDGTVDDQATAVLLEISLPVKLTRQEVREEDLSSALLQFRRRATQVAQLEDWYIFNGTYPSGDLVVGAALTSDHEPKIPSYRPDATYLEELVRLRWPFLRGAPEPIADHRTQRRGLSLRNPGALGLIEGPRVARQVQGGGRAAQAVQQDEAPLDNDGLMRAIVEAMESLEDHGYVAPYVCVFGRSPFNAAHRPIPNSTALPRDRLEPLIGRELLHASAIDVAPHKFSGYTQPDDEAWQSRGVLLSVAGEGVDLAIAAEATPEFIQVDAQGRYVFSVFERFTLRIKDAAAIAPLKFKDPPGSVLPSLKKEAVPEAKRRLRRTFPWWPGRAPGQGR